MALTWLKMGPSFMKVPARGEQSQVMVKLSTGLRHSLDLAVISCWMPTSCSQDKIVCSGWEVQQQQGHSLDLWRVHRQLMDTSYHFLSLES